MLKFMAVKMTKLALFTALFFALASCASEDAYFCKSTGEAISQTVVFKNGEAGYAAFRIPSLLVCNEGLVFAFAEGRKNSPKDYGQIDSVYKISKDFGRTWSELNLIAGNGRDSFTNPMALQDAKSGAINFLCSYSSGDVNEWQMIRGESAQVRQILMRRSFDSGKTWGKLENISSQTRHDDATWAVVGPSGGIQISGGKFDGRLIVPVAAASSAKSEPYPYFVWAIYSDDGGASWKKGEKIPTSLNVNESQIAQIDGDIIVINSRVQQGKGHFKCPNRHISASRDGGVSWFLAALDDELPETVCEASFKSVARPKDGGRILLFSNPSPEVGAKESIHWKRKNLVLRFSDSRTYREWIESGAPQASPIRRWKASIVVDSGNCAYSDIAVFPDGNIGVLYERGEKTPYEEISLKIFKFSDAKVSTKEKL